MLDNIAANLNACPPKRTASRPQPRQLTKYCPKQRQITVLRYYLDSTDAVIWARSQRPRRH